MRILAIDPGTEKSAMLLLDDGTGAESRTLLSAKQEIVTFGIFDNDQVCVELHHLDTKAWSTPKGMIALAPSDVVIEMVACYGMPVGREVFETAVWIGRFMEASMVSGRLPKRIFRRDEKMTLCHTMKANDAAIRAALIDMFGPGREKAIGTKKAPGPLYGVKKDVWAALAVAVTFYDMEKERHG